MKRVASLLLILAMCHSALGQLAIAAPVEATSGAQQTTLQGRRASRAILGKYRRARRDLAGKQAAVVEALAVGPVAVEPLLKLIDGELQPKLQRYRQQFLKGSRVAASRKFREANLQEVARLQQQVNVLRDDQNLTKEKIVRLGDPAMKKLQSLVLLDRQTVLAADRRLVEQRRAMAGIGQLWGTCHAYLAKKDVDEAGDAGDEKGQLLGFEDYLLQRKHSPCSWRFPCRTRPERYLPLMVSWRQEWVSKNHVVSWRSTSRGFFWGTSRLRSIYN